MIKNVISSDDEIKDIVKATNLKHIAVIMDGNRRWAKEKHLPSAVGHKKGVDSLRNTLRLCDRVGIKYLTVYAFSTENWKRSEQEVKFLMELVVETLSNELDEMDRENVQIHFIGNTDKLSEKVKRVIQNAQEKTKNNSGVVLQIAFNYGARAEIVYAVQEIIKSGIKYDKIDEELISKYLYTKNVPDPDILIRTGGEQRISNYLLWQIAYSEIIIRDEFWPDFDKTIFYECIDEFGKRQRRYGK